MRNVLLQRLAYCHAGRRVDVAGRQSAAGDLRLDISSQPAGICLLRLEAGGKTRTYKIAKQ